MKDCENCVLDVKDRIEEEVDCDYCPYKVVAK